MSGIVGLINLDGTPVDRALLLVLAEKLERRGPDRQEIWCQGRVGFGHTLLQTTVGSDRERQPSTLDGQVWITSDARVDARDELLRELRHEGRTVSTDATDDALLLHAYDVWGEECPRHLLGDFAFAIWDTRLRRLFCARDHIGVKPFFYAIAAGCLVFASELSCIRQHPAVSTDLDDLAVTDALMFGWLQEAESTIFAGVRRLPPAHSLTWTDGTLSRKRYWQLEAPPETHYARPEEYVERFQTLLDAAVADRLGTERAGVFMSGGLDSTIVAAAARSPGSATSRPELRAFTVVYEGLMPDQERRYAGIAADALDIPVSILPAGSYPLFAGWDDGSWPMPEPAADPQRKVDVDVVRAAMGHARVALTGWDGDSLCQAWFPGHLRRLLQSLQLSRALSEVVWFMRSRRSMPPTGLRTRLRSRGEREDALANFPAWLRPELARSLCLRERWEQRWAPSRAPSRPAKADALELLAGCSFLPDVYDPAVTGSPVEVRHPLLDLRVVRFALSVPPTPWCVDKHLLREVARRRLPPAIYSRPKSPLSRDPLNALVANDKSGWVDELRLSPLLERYVVPDALPGVRGLRDSPLLQSRLLVAGFELWLRRQDRGS